jgi:RecJ-like exonuclease
MYRMADEKIEEAALNTMKTMKEKKAGETSVHLIDLESVVKKGEFPNRSKVTTRVFEKLNGEEPLVVLGLGERTIIIRINDAAAAKGASADKIAKQILQSMPDFAESGGGHVKAGAIRVKVGFVDSVVEEIIRSLD